MSDFVVGTNGPITMSVDQTTRIIEAISPTLTLTRTEDGLKITVKDKSGTSEAMVYDGTNGQDGQTGPQGEPGPMPVLSIGNVATGEPGSSVTVTLTGTDANPVLNMSIPKGDKGDTGNTGATGVGISNVVVNADYTLTVTMTNGTTYTSGSIRGEKGETGDTGETGATPQFSIGLVETLAPSEDAYVALDESSTEEFPILNFGLPQGADGDATVDDTAGSGDTAHVWSADKSVKAIVESATTKADIIGVEEAVQAPVKTLPDGAAGAKMAVTVGIEPVQAGSGDPSPSNVRAISGWSAVKISRTGKNLLDSSSENLYSGKIVNSYMSLAVNALFNTTKALIPVKPNTTYACRMNKTDTTNAAMWIVYCDANGTYKSRSDVIEASATSGLKTGTVTTPSDACFVVFSIPVAANSYQFEEGSTATDYQAYNGNQYTITIPSTPGTVYGGSLTVNKDGTGKLIVDRSLITVDGTETFNDVTSANVFYIQKNDFNVFAVSSSDDYCSMFKPVAATGSSAMSDGEIARQTTANARIHVKSSVFSGYTAAQLGTYFSNNNMQVCFKLATPASYDLTAAQVNAIITSLKGLNNIFADSGDVISVDYDADTKLYIDEGQAEDAEQATAIRAMIADSDSMVTTESHAQGDVFICDNKLLRALSAIASGATVTIGTNAEVINLADYIAEVIASVSSTQANLLNRMQDTTEKFMLLNSTNCGTDQSINTYSNQTKVSRHMNHVTFRKLGTSTTYYYVLIYGGDMQVVSKSAYDSNGPKAFSNATPIQIPYRITNNTLSDWAMDIVSENLTPSVQNGTSVGIATYDSVNDTYTYAWMSTLTQGESKRAESINLVKLLPEIATNRNFIIYARVRTGESQGDYWFNLHAIPHDATT